MHERNSVNGTFSTIHFLETSSSILHEIPGIELKDTKVCQFLISSPERGLYYIDEKIITCTSSVISIEYLC